MNGVFFLLLHIEDTQETEGGSWKKEAERRKGGLLLLPERKGVRERPFIGLAVFWGKKIPLPPLPPLCRRSLIGPTEERERVRELSLLRMRCW